MLNALKALQQAEFVTNTAGQPVVQITLADWEVIQAAIRLPIDEPEDSFILQLFLNFITAEALAHNQLQPYTVEMSETAHHLIAGVSFDDE
jgi:hypothetical protein